MSRLGNITGRLYRGEVSIDFVSRKKLWYTISGIILLVSILALIFRGLDYSVEFKGGSQWDVPVASATQQKLEQIVTNAGGVSASASEVRPFNGTQAFWQVQAGLMPTKRALHIGDEIAAAYHLPATGKNAVSVTTVGSSWGSQVSKKALEALIAFLIVIVIYLTIAFEWRMAAAAFVALAHDIVITIGVYALTGFQVSPATVIGLLTILGYSLYDTVVVFDKVRENTAPILGTRKSTYSQAANLALNQTLVRSINTSLTALLPVAAILVVGTLLLGNGELKDLSLVLFVGMLSGTYSSICIATPVLADLKERMPQYKQLAKQVALRAAGGRAAQRKAAKSGATVATAGKAAGNGGATAAGVAGAGPGSASGVTQGPARTGPARGALGAGGAGLADGDLAGADLTGADPTRADLTGASDDDLAPDDVVDEAVPAASAAAAQARGASARQPGARQQPVRRPAAKRRPSGKKKRR
jgi:preprotein translocase subunit SecF